MYRYVERITLTLLLKSVCSLYVCPTCRAPLGILARLASCVSCVKDGHNDARLINTPSQRPLPSSNITL